MPWAPLLGLFLALIAGGIGLPFPEDVALLLFGALAGQRGAVRLHHVIVVGFLGVVVAGWIIYLVGRRYGTDLVAHPRLARLFGAARLDAVR